MTRWRDHNIDLTRRGSLAPKRRRVGVGLPILLFVSLSLLALSRMNHSVLTDARQALSDLITPALQAAMVPLEPVRATLRSLTAGRDIVEDYDRLKIDNQKLANWEWRARQLERRVADLERLSKAVIETRLEFITARVIGDSSGAFRRSVIVDAGTLQKVTGLFPVINGDGLVGRIVEIGKNTSRVLLLTDLNSRVPVSVGKTAVRAMLAGDNGSKPRLIYVEPGTTLTPGDDVWTSGMGGGFPRDLRIGTVIRDGATDRVQLRADLNTLQYVSVLFYDDPAQSLIDHLDRDLKVKAGSARRRDRSSLVLPPDMAQPGVAP